MPRKVAAGGGEPDCTTDAAPLGSSEAIPGAGEAIIGLTSDMTGGSRGSQTALECANLGRGRMDPPRGEQPVSPIEAATTTLHRVIAELTAGRGSVDAKRAQLGSELEGVLEALTVIIEQHEALQRLNTDLKALLRTATDDADSKQRTLMDQQDAVLEALLTEHERQIQFLEHETQLQNQYMEALRRELDEKAGLVEALRTQTAVSRRTTPSSELPEREPHRTPAPSKTGEPAQGRVSVARLVADRDHLLASLRLLKRQRDDAQQETLDLVEQLAAANNEVEWLRSQLPSVTAPPVPASSWPAAAATPDADVSAPAELPRALRGGSVSGKPPLSRGSRRTVQPAAVPRASRAPTLPPHDTETIPNLPEPPDAAETLPHGAPTADLPSFADSLPGPKPLRSPAVPHLPPASAVQGLAGCSSQAGREAQPVQPTPGGSCTAAGALLDPLGGRLEPRALSDRKPPLKRKPDPTQSPLGVYSLTGPAEPESLRQPSGRSGSPPSRRRP